MTDEEKLKVFEYYLNKIEVPIIKEFTEFCLLNVPSYFWTLKSSTTGLNHAPGQTLIDHVKNCLVLAEQICDCQFKDHWTARQKAQLYSALILHDTFRCGEPGEECRISQEYINKKGLDQSLLGNLSTSREHPIIGQHQIILLSVKFNQLAKENKTDMIGEKNLSVIANSILYHYGSFLEVKSRPYSLSWPFDSVVVQTHNIDFLESRMSNLRGKLK